MCTLHRWAESRPRFQGARTHRLCPKQGRHNFPPGLTCRLCVVGDPEDQRLGAGRGAPCWLHWTPRPRDGEAGAYMGGVQMPFFACTSVHIPSWPFSASDVGFWKMCSETPAQASQSQGVVLGSSQDPSCSSLLGLPQAWRIFLSPVLPLGQGLADLSLAVKAGQQVSGALWTLQPVPASHRSCWAPKQPQEVLP